MEQMHYQICPGTLNLIKHAFVPFLNSMCQNVKKKNPQKTSPIKEEEKVVGGVKEDGLGDSGNCGFLHCTLRQTDIHMAVMGAIKN